MSAICNGCTNDADYITVIKQEMPKINNKRVRKTVWRCRIFTTWKCMVERCYGNTKSPTYEGVVTCNEWRTFSNFKAWMEQQDYVDKQLDKDLLIQGNKIYSPETCMFVSNRINSLLLDVGRKRGVYPLGVHFSSKRNLFVSQIRECMTKIFLGRFKTSTEAHKAWQAAKKCIIYDIAQEQIDERLKAALLLRCNQLQYDIDNGLETIKL